MYTEQVISSEAGGGPAVRTEEPAIVVRPRSYEQDCCSALNKRKSDGVENQILNVLKANLEEQPKTLIHEPDEMFLLSQLPHIKKMKPCSKLQFQIQFMQLIQKYSSPNATSFESTSLSTPS